MAAAVSRLFNPTSIRNEAGARFENDSYLLAQDQYRQGKASNPLIGRPSHQAQSCMLKLDRSYYVIKNSQFVLPVLIQSLRLRIEVMLFLSANEIYD